MSSSLWREAFRTHIPEIDEQHISLFETAAAFADALERGDGDHAVRSVLFTLLDYTRTHFAAEEVLMQRAGYPGLEDHARTHAKFVLTLRQWIDDLSRVNPREVQVAIEKWLVGHVAGSDPAYVPYVLRESAHLKNR
jgi:hemerythrin-like metal-binding protein